VWTYHTNRPGTQYETGNFANYRGYFSPVSFCGPQNEEEDEICVLERVFRICLPNRDVTAAVYCWAWVANSR